MQRHHRRGRRRHAPLAFDLFPWADQPDGRRLIAIAGEALERGLGLEWAQITGDDYRGARIGRARRIVAQYLLSEGCPRHELARILGMTPRRALEYSWYKHYVQRKDAFARDRSYFRSALGRVLILEELGQIDLNPPH